MGTKGKKMLIGGGLLVMFAGCTAVVSEDPAEQEAVIEEREELEAMREEQAKQQAAHDAREAEAEAKAEAEKETEFQTETPDLSEQESKELNEQEVLHIMEENMAGVATVEYYPNMQMFRLVPTDPRMVDAIEAIVQGYGHDQFMELQYTLETLSTSVMDKLGEGYTITMTNPANTENDILIVTDGVTVYNALDDLQ